MWQTNTAPHPAQCFLTVLRMHKNNCSMPTMAELSMEA